MPLSPMAGGLRSTVFLVPKTKRALYKCLLNLSSTPTSLSLTCAYSSKKAQCPALEGALNTFMQQRMNARWPLPVFGVQGPHSWNHLPGIWTHVVLAELLECLMRFKSRTETCPRSCFMKRSFLAQITGETRQLSIYFLEIRNAYKHTRGSKKMSCS